MQCSACVPVRHTEISGLEHAPESSSRRKKRISADSTWCRIANEQCQMDAGGNYGEADGISEKARENDEDLT